MLAVAALVSLAILGGFFVSTIAERDWHEVASVNGVSISRAQLRSRMVLDAFLARVRTESIRAATQAGRLTKDVAATLVQQAASSTDPVNRALDELIDEEVLRQGARSIGVSAPGADVGAELVAATIIDARLRVRWVTLAGPQPPSFEPADARVADALRAGQLPAEIVTAASRDGWIASGADAWLPIDGRAPPIQGLGSTQGKIGDVPPSVLVAARSASPGATLGPFTDEVIGAVTTGLLVETATDGPDAASARQQATDSGLDGATLDSWALARALRRAVTERLVSTWMSSPADQVRAAELVLGAPPDGGNPGPYVELGHLVIKQLNASPPQAATPTNAAELAAQLRALPIADRIHRFAELASLANRAPSTDPLTRSGETGVFTKGNLLASLGTLAFAPAARGGDILGPIQTSEGDELFLLEARYAGALDEATIAALIAARAPNADFAAMAARIDAALVARARSGPWRARPELAKADPASSLLDTPVDVVGDPMVLDGQLVVPRVLEHRTAPEAGALLDRLRLGGFAAWLVDQRAGAAITRQADPLNSGRPSVQPSPSGLPSIPADTPFLPSIPGGVGPGRSTNPLSFPVAP